MAQVAKLGSLVMCTSNTNKFTLGGMKLSLGLYKTLVFQTFVVGCPRYMVFRAWSLLSCVFCTFLCHAYLWQRSCTDW